MRKQMDQSHIHFDGKSLGKVQFSPQDFPEALYQEFESPAFKKLDIFHKHERVSALLFEELSKRQGEVFLLPHTLSFIARVQKFLSGYNFASFEFWLNHYSSVSEEKKMEVRGKIVGKYIPRASYQVFFPIGGGEVFPGPHFSFAHVSPDLDTTVASFSCFLAAFGANIAEGRHHWVIPGGPPKGSMEIEFVFKKALGKEIFESLASSQSRLSISSLDLLTQKHVMKKQLNDLSFGIDHGRGEKAVIVVDQAGHYLADWRDNDVDAVRAIISRFTNMVSSLHNEVIIGLISILSHKELKKSELQGFLAKSMKRQINDGVVAREFTEQGRHQLDLFIKKVLKIPGGYGVTLDDFFGAFQKFGFADLKSDLTHLLDRDLFNSQGEMIGDRSATFKSLEGLVLQAKSAVEKFIRYTDSLEIALEIKKEVLKLEPHYISHLADYDEITGEMGRYRHMTVNYREGDKLFPMGVIHADSLKKKVIATSSWNDFSNPQETDAREEVEVISFIDHHKSSLMTGKPALGIVKDAQSSNSIVSNLQFEINDRYSAGGQTLESINTQIQEVLNNLENETNRRLLARLLRRKSALLSKGEYYISYEREFIEYLQGLFAILDDTDLLTKVTEYDVDCMASLLNRLKSLMLRKEVEIIHFDDLSRSDPSFCKKAAKKLLQNNDLYSLYSIIYQAKEGALDTVLREAASGLNASFFQDTKVINGYAEVGQIKRFANNEATFNKKIGEIRQIWVERCKTTYANNPEINLYLFMVSTIYSAEELFADRLEQPNYRDEIWFWTPEGDKKGAYHLKAFLSEFCKSPKMHSQKLEAEFYGRDDRFEKSFTEAIPKHFDKKSVKGEAPLALLKVDQKSIKSRKSDIATYL